MNHRGEILPLTQLVKPHAALVTTIAPAHVENLGSLEAVADEKGDIYAGLEPGGAALVPNEAPHAERLIAAAERNGATSDPLRPRAGVRSAAAEVRHGRDRLDRRSRNPRPHDPLSHRRRRRALGAQFASPRSPPPMSSAPISTPPRMRCEHLRAFDGRGVAARIEAPFGAFMLVDDSYNANPASMAAAFATLGARKPGAGGRRIAALGDMLELGAERARLSCRPRRAH